MAEDLPQPPPQHQQQSHHQPPTKPKLSISEIRNSDLVSRLLAATPAYLYQSPVGPHNFFFSEMLRSLVQNRNSPTSAAAAAAMASEQSAPSLVTPINSSQRNERQQQIQQQSLAQSQQQHSSSSPLQISTASMQPNRRPRKRAWSHQHRSGGNYEMPSKEFRIHPTDKLLISPITSTPTQQTVLSEKPLELTNKHLINSSFQLPKLTKNENISTSPPPLPPPPMIQPTQQSQSSPSSVSNLYNNTKTESEIHGDKIESSSITNIINQQSLPPSEPSLALGPPSDLVLPPPPPMWYPPLYPPYGIDPLHFFIDLRVSGHIYDRKKENLSPNILASSPPSIPSSLPLNNNTINASSIRNTMTDSIGKHRLGSAFSVPPQRHSDNNKSPTSSALNLTSTGCSMSPSTSPTPSSSSSSSFIRRSSKSPSQCGNNKSKSNLYNPHLFESLTNSGKEFSKNTNYVLQNLPRIYTSLSSSSASATTLMSHQNHQSNVITPEERNSVNSEETDSKSDFDIHDELLVIEPNNNKTITTPIINNECHMKIDETSRQKHDDNSCCNVDNIGNSAADDDDDDDSNDDVVIVDSKHSKDY